MLKFLLLSLTLFANPASGANEPLDPELAYKFSARALDARTLEAQWKIADGYYMYRDKIKFSLGPGSEAVRLGAPQFPAGKVKDDEFFGKVEVYRKELKILLPIETPADMALTSVLLKASSQGCADIGICYPPLPQQASVQLVKASGGSPAAGISQERPLTTPGPSADSGGDESSRIAHLLKNASIWTILLFFFGAGLALAFTPCMFPMVPILSGIIVGHGHDIGKSRAFVLSLVYVLGMALTYAAFGIAAGLSGTLLSSALQNAWVLGAFALVFVALALAMFGFYELQLPPALQSKLADEANLQQGGSLHGVALMGSLSAIIVGPCVAAPLAGALLYIARTGDAVLGGVALFIMALGMGLPLLLIGTSARHLLPRPGPWMEAIKQCFGVLLLGVAIWLVSPVIPALVQMLAWAALLIFSAIYLHALDPLPPHAHGWHKFGKGLGVLALLVGAALLLGVLGGSRDPLQPLSFLRIGAAASDSSGVKFQRVKSLADLDARVKLAGRPVLLDFYADWCVSCKEMERFTFSDPAVAARMNRMLLLQADVTANSDEDKALLQRFGLFGPPGIIFFDHKGREAQDLRVVGYQDAAWFGGVLDQALALR
ncbi:MAG: protein-disulfide reductase DsbD [Rhodocyclaceae bacterium]|nr:MAG: protein-disulfide reductase DsbD [Rhodocyclaceae bacterium]